QKLSVALKSRDERLIRRRLPEFPQIGSSRCSQFRPRHPRFRWLALARSGPAHAALEERLRRFFDSEAAILFNSGFDANVGLFSAVPQPGDVVVYDELIHASVHDGMRTSRLSRDSLVSFAHNSVPSLRHTLRRALAHREDLKTGKSSVFVAVESLYSMDGTFAPLSDIVDCVEEMLPLGNGYVIVDEAHATGIYGPKGRGLVAALGLEKRIFARLHTFGKSLAASGGKSIKLDHLKECSSAESQCEYQEAGHESLWGADESGNSLGWDGRQPTKPPQSSTRTPSQPFQFPSQIIPLLTTEPRSLSSFLLAFLPSECSSVNTHHAPASVAIFTKPIFPPTVPRETSRVRICLHAGHTREEVEILIQGIVAWAQRRIEDALRSGKEWNQMASDVGVRAWMESKL
ncbi:PLP-dependent transferase, partial [Pisolithus thermaeus]